MDPFRILVVRLAPWATDSRAARVATLSTLSAQPVSWLLRPRWIPLSKKPVRRRNHSAGSYDAASRRARQLRAERFNLAVDLQGLIQSALAAGISRATKSWASTIPGGGAMASLVYSTGVVTARAHCRSQPELVAAAGASSILERSPSRRRSGRRCRRRFVLTSPFAGWRPSMAVERFEQLARLLDVPLG